MTLCDPPPDAFADAQLAAALILAAETMEATLSIADALVADGRRIDLAGLDAEAERLCGAMLAAPRGMAGTLRPRLEAVIRALDRLTARLARC